MTCPQFTDWKEAYLFADGELWASFAALAHGDLEVAKALNESGLAANQLAQQLMDSAGGTSA